jgi:hypothetical protein
LQKKYFTTIRRPFRLLLSVLLIFSYLHRFAAFHGKTGKKFVFYLQSTKRNFFPSGSQIGLEALSLPYVNCFGELLPSGTNGIICVCICNQFYFFRHLLRM